MSASDSYSDDSRRYQYVPIAPPDYFRQAGNINIAPPIERMQQFRGPDNYYQNPVSMPVAPVITPIYNNRP